MNFDEVKIAKKKKKHRLKTRKKINYCTEMMGPKKKKQTIRLTFCYL